ncbi:MAG: FG-GAP repeat protein [Ignavibacteria bacterium]|nr:FG-GAP repeat protein [Ignavibacteria bacterium]
MNNTADVVMTGAATGDLFGISVRSAGDVNGDGYSDVIIGANRSYSSWTGGANIYFGGSSMNNTADVILVGEAAYNLFGFSVSSAGDVNGDGFSDVIVAAYGYYSNTGRAYIYFGGVAMNNTADLIMTGEAIDSYYGVSVSTAGDVNGDGFSDVIVGASGITPEFGKAYIYFGGTSMNNGEDVTMTGEQSTNYFGGSVSSAGDVNGDGYSDVIIGADGFISNTGKAYLFFGGTSMNNTPDATMTGETTNNFFGRSVSTAGDVNGDGYTDLIVGAFKNSSETGRVYLYDYFMKNEIAPDMTMTGSVPHARFGMSVASAGDVNGDGFSDVIVGADAYSNYTGAAYIFFGGPSMDNIADVTMSGTTFYDSFGFSVSSAGDVNGDGYSDVIIGAYGEFVFNSYTGRAYIFFGGPSMDNVPDVTMAGETVGGRYGWSVSTAEDVNGDGYADVIVGALSYSSSKGRSYIYFGGVLPDNTADVFMYGEAAGDEFGVSVSTAGDVNGDGYSDVIIGADQYSSNTGRAYIFFGGSSPDNTADMTLTGEAINSYFGRAVSCAGDVNGDGYSDVIVGEPANTSATGRSYIYFGGTLLDNNPDVTLQGETTGSRFGFFVSTAGDVNGDGYSDVIVSAYGYSTWTGKAYVYFGGSSMNNTADLTMTGEATFNYFAQNVSSAGDVNGDGYSDLFVGSPSYATVGRTYIYLGSAISAKPILNYVKDVPDDQGGKVNIKWARSGFDVTGNSMITDYIVYRSYPPSGGGFSWEPVATLIATKRSFYTLTDRTPSDSSANGNGTMFYQIMARTINSNVYWLSGILSGRSLDNIAPPVVSPFTATSVANNVQLSWGNSSAPDLLNYILYRSTSSTIDPDNEPVFAMTNELTYLDTSPLSGVYYYYIVAQDIHNNKSPVAVAESPNITLNLTLFIEGMYNAANDAQVSDTITVELRNATSPYGVVDVAKSVAETDGSAVLKFDNAANGIYYIAVKHRNSIETWSANAVTLSRTEPTTYDLSLSLSQAFGNNLIQIDALPLRFGIYSGDVNDDGTIDATDLSAIDNDASNFIGGYVVTDLNGDDFVDATDIAIADNHAANFVSVIRP